MLRIHFSPEDLLRIRIAAEPHPMWEMLLSLHMLQTGEAEPVFGPWRRQARARLAPPVALLKTLARPKGYSPDFLTPAGEVPDLDTGLELLLSTPRAQLRADITRLASRALLPPWVAGLAQGEPDALRRLAESLRWYHAGALEPHWDTVRAQVRADRRNRAEIAMTSGFETVLRTLHQAVRWQSPVLEVAYPVEQDLRLRGRGLTLVPSFFCWQTPITLFDDTHQPMLVYPVEHTPAWTDAEADRAPSANARSLTALLGRTRAAVLRAIADRPHMNTTELARALGITPAGVSQHTTVLRNAGLVATSRHNGAAIHRVSDRGASLLAR